MTWTTRVNAVDVITGERKSIMHTDEATMGLVLQLATCRADFVWDGKRALGNPPFEPVTIPGPLSAQTLINTKEQASRLRVEELADGGVRLIPGTDTDGKWTPSGLVVDVPKHMIKYVTREVTTGKEQKK